MTLEKWIIHPGETRVIDIEDVRRLKVGLIGGQIDVIAHDEPGRASRCMPSRSRICASR